MTKLFNLLKLSVDDPAKYANKIDHSHVVLVLDWN